jgi:hypothetical protein
MSGAVPLHFPTAFMAGYIEVFSPFTIAMETAEARSFQRNYKVVQLVQVLRYKPEGHRFDSRWCHWNFSLTQPLTEMSTKNIS